MRGHCLTLINFLIAGNHCDNEHKKKVSVHKYEIT